MERAHEIRHKMEDGSAFFDFKRLVAETISTMGILGMAVEVLIKVIAYNLYKRIRADIISITGNNIDVAED